MEMGFWIFFTELGTIPFAALGILCIYPRNHTVRGVNPLAEQSPVLQQLGEVVPVAGGSDVLAAQLLDPLEECLTLVGVVLGGLLNTATHEVFIIEAYG